VRSAQLIRYTLLSSSLLSGVALVQQPNAAWLRCDLDITVTETHWEGRHKEKDTSSESKTLFLVIDKSRDALFGWDGTLNKLHSSVEETRILFDYIGDPPVSQAGSYRYVIDRRTLAIKYGYLRVGEAREGYGTCKLIPPRAVQQNQF
jgi:hypothetical protein